jgi:Spy/CpxP family protein refolding chaperone
MGRVDVVGWGSDGTLVSWLGAQDGQSVLRVARLDTALAEAERLVVATLPPGRMTGMPRMASHGDAAILVWTSPEVRGGKVRGVLLRDAAASTAAKDQEAPDWLDAGERAVLENAGGHGMARAAEANALPGPKHALELADQLRLDAAQRAALEDLYARMRAEALPAGRVVLAAESALDAELARAQPDPERVLALSEATGEARGRLRAVHLNAHVAAARVLDAAQREQYAALRHAASKSSH